ncbi:MAG: DNA adenine methylase [Candidatus Borkfalkiaceae bacterium]|nr:DNA adenine methylase [Christensenellaceae bacterium]
MNPFIKYPGGKIKEFPLVIRYKPKTISRYFEPFAGGAAIYLNIGIKRSYINDKSKDLATFYEYIKKQNSDFFNCLIELDDLWKGIESKNEIKSSLINCKRFTEYYERTLMSKRKKLLSLEQSGIDISERDKNDMVLTAKKTAFYMCVRDLYNDENQKITIHTACFYFMREYCYSSMFRFAKNGKFNVPYGGRSYNFKRMTPKIERMKSCETVNYFKNTEIFNLDFETFLDLFKLDGNDFIFLDPPYDSDFSTYDNNSFNKNEQIRLFEYLTKTRAKWLLIIKKTDFIYKLYKDFNILEYDKNYAVSFKNRNDREVKHLLITNYDIGDK